MRTTTAAFHDLIAYPATVETMEIPLHRARDSIIQLYMSNSLLIEFFHLFP
jgi:hypothetical protein